MIERRSALSAHASFKPGTVAGPVADGQPAVTIAERAALAILQVSAFHDSIAAAGERLTAAIGLAPPAANRSGGDDTKSIRAIGPGVWQIVGVEGGLPAAKDLRAQLSGMATVVDLGHARTALRVSGRDAARTLAKHCALDLDTARFPIGGATNTRFGHLGITLARIDETSFELLVFRGYAEFVFEALLEAATEFGVQIS